MQYAKANVGSYIKRLPKGVELKDEEILKDIDFAKLLYKDGALVEAADILTGISNAIYLFDVRRNDK